IAPGSPLYNIPAAIRLKGSLNCDALIKSLNTLLTRHESLRSNFVSDAGVPSQIIRENSAMELPFIHIPGKNVHQRENALREILLSESQKPFDLGSDLLIRASVFRLDPDDHVLFLNMHHIISDEWSMRVLFHELAILYQDHRAGREPSLPELPVQYADF